MGVGTLFINIATTFTFRKTPSILSEQFTNGEQVDVPMFEYTAVFLYWQ